MGFNEDCVRSAAPLFAGCVIVGKLLHLSKHLRFLLKQQYFIGFEMYVKQLAKCLANSKGSIN